MTRTPAPVYQPLGRESALWFYGSHDGRCGSIVMRRRSWYEWHWSPWYQLDDGAHYVVARREVWDVRCLQAPCRRSPGRMTARMERGRHRRRAGDRYR
jgi:hypothetical protein